MVRDETVGDETDGGRNDQILYIVISKTYTKPGMVYQMYIPSLYSLRIILYIPPINSRAGIALDEDDLP